MNMLHTLLSFLIALTVLIFVHEMGHYLVARWCGVKVLRFSIGFGKPLARWSVGPDRTEWTLSAIPLGGYVRMLDERDPPEGGIPAAELSRAFTRKPLSRRALIVAAGPAANFLLAILLYLLLNTVGVMEPAARLDAPPAGSAAATAGVREGDVVVGADGRDVRSWNEVRLRLIDAVIERRSVAIEVERDGGRQQLSLDASTLPEGEVERDFARTLGLHLAGGAVQITGVVPGSAAERAGLLAGDEVVALDGTAMRHASELVEGIRANPQQPVRLDVIRDSQRLRIEVTPEAQPSERPEDDGRMIGRMGAGVAGKLAMVEVRYGALEASQRAVRQTWDMSVFSLRMLGKMVTGDLSWRNLSGPVAIADYAGQSARVGWHAYVGFLALISISLGVLNLLPIPVLDGGHLLYYGLEAVRGRPLSERFLEVTQRAGLLVIAAMMVLALFNDLSRLIG